MAYVPATSIESAEDIIDLPQGEYRNTGTIKNVWIPARYTRDDDERTHYALINADIPKRSAISIDSAGKASTNIIHVNWMMDISCDELQEVRCYACHEPATCENLKLASYTYRVPAGAEI